MNRTPLLSVKDLGVVYPGRAGQAPNRVLEGVSFNIRAGEAMGLVGESGSGKTTIGRALLGLAKPSEGTITFEGQDITHAARKKRRALSKDIQVVFQDPYTSLNPSMTVEDILSEPLTVAGWSKQAATDRVRKLMDRVHLPANAHYRLPREFSGGQRQRIAIARALALKPKLIVCDEPVSALDLTTQGRVLDLFTEIQEDTGVAYLFITHDLSVVRAISHSVGVLFRGQIVEKGKAADVTTEPQHPYTRKLFMASPVPDPARQKIRRQKRQEFITEQKENQSA